MQVQSSDSGRSASGALWTAQQPFVHYYDQYNHSHRQPDCPQWAARDILPEQPGMRKDQRKGHIVASEWLSRRP